MFFFGDLISIYKGLDCRDGAFIFVYDAHAAAPLLAWFISG